MLSEASVFSAIDGAELGSIKPKHSENFVERIVRVRLSYSSPLVLPAERCFQNLNNKLTVLGTFAVLHPWRIACFVVIGLIVLYMILKRLIADDTSDSHPPLKKSDRLD